MYSEKWCDPTVASLCSSFMYLRKFVWTRTSVTRHGARRWWGWGGAMVLVVIKKKLLAMWIMLALLLLFRCQIALPLSDDDKQLGRQLRCLECKVLLSWGPRFKWSQIFRTYKYWENAWSAVDIGNASWWSSCTRRLCCVCRGFVVALTFGRKHFARCEMGPKERFSDGNYS